HVILGAVYAARSRMLLRTLRLLSSSRLVTPCRSRPWRSIWGNSSSSERPLTSQLQSLWPMSAHLKVFCPLFSSAMCFPPVWNDQLYLDGKQGGERCLKIQGVSSCGSGKAL